MNLCPTQRVYGVVEAAKGNKASAWWGSERKAVQTKSSWPSFAWQSRSRNNRLIWQSFSDKTVTEATTSLFSIAGKFRTDVIDHKGNLVAARPSILVMQKIWECGEHEPVTSKLVVCNSNLKETPNRSWARFPGFRFRARAREDDCAGI